MTLIHFCLAFRIKQIWNYNIMKIKNFGRPRSPWAPGGQKMVVMQNVDYSSLKAFPGRGYSHIYIYGLDWYMPPHRVWM